MLRAAREGTLTGVAVATLYSDHQSFSTRVVVDLKHNATCPRHGGHARRPVERLPERGGRNGRVEACDADRARIAIAAPAAAVFVMVIFAVSGRVCMM